MSASSHQVSAILVGSKAPRSRPRRPIRELLGRPPRMAEEASRPARVSSGAAASSSSPGRTHPRRSSHAATSGQRQARVAMEVGEHAALRCRGVCGCSGRQHRRLDLPVRARRRQRRTRRGRGACLARTRAAGRESEPHRRFAGRVVEPVTALLGYRPFLAEYRAARQRWIQGREAMFPPGTYWLAKFAAVPVASVRGQQRLAHAIALDSTGSPIDGAELDYASSSPAVGASMPTGCSRRRALGGRRSRPARAHVDRRRREHRARALTAPRKSGIRNRNGV